MGEATRAATAARAAQYEPSSDPSLPDSYSTPPGRERILSNYARTWRNAHNAVSPTGSGSAAGAISDATSIASTNDTDWRGGRSYAELSYSFHKRTAAEKGLKIELGATKGDIYRMLMRMRRLAEVEDLAPSS